MCSCSAGGQGASKWVLDFLAWTLRVFPRGIGGHGKRMPVWQRTCLAHHQGVCGAGPFSSLTPTRASLSQFPSLQAFLEGQGCSSELIHEVLTTISSIGFKEQLPSSQGQQRPQMSVEAQVLQDADRWALCSGLAWPSRPQQRLSLALW